MYIIKLQNIQSTMQEENINQKIQRLKEEKAANRKYKPKKIDLIKFFAKKK